MSDFVTPEIVRLPLSGGAYIDIKKRLNHGEREDLFARWAPFVTPGEPLQFQRREMRTAKVLVYLLGWSFLNAGTPVPFTPDMAESARLDLLRGLDPDRFREVHDAIVDHEIAEEARREAEKKTHDGSTPAAATLP